MRKIINVTFSFLVVFGSISCQQKNSEISNYEADTAKFSKTLVKAGTKSFDLDSITPYYSSCLQLYKDANREQYLCFLNSYNNTLYFYGYEDGKIHHQLSFQREGLNKAGEVQSFAVKNMDSIYVLSKKDFSLSLVNKEGKVIDSHKLRFFSEALTVRPMVIHNNKIYVGSYEVPGIDQFTESTNFASENLISIYDIKTRKISSVLSYPESYKGGVWGPYLSQFYYTFNPLTEKFIISFSADHSIYETNFTENSVSHRAGSSFFTNIPSWKVNETDADARLKYYLSTPSFQGILFDPYQNLYYRIALQAISNDELMSDDPDKSGIKHASIIILDHNFKKIGETLLPRFSYTETMCFVSPDGLHLGSWEASKQDENKLVFGIFKLADASHGK